MLDIGSNFAYFDVRLMEDFDCVCTLIDNKFVAPVLRANNCLEKTVVIQKHVSASVLEALSRSEHFDLVLGLAAALPVVIFGMLHIRNARNRPNRRAVRAGYALFTASLILAVSFFFFYLNLVAH